MSDKALSSLTQVSALDTGDGFYVVQGGNSRRAQVGQVRQALALDTGDSPSFDGLTLSGNATSRSTSAGVDTDALLSDTGITGGFFSDFDCKGANKIVLVQSEDQTAIDGGGYRDALFIQHVDRDLEDYEPNNDQKISVGLRCYVTGYNDGAGYQAQYKDLVAAEFAAVGRTDWTPRNIGGITATAIQYGPGGCTNEFRAFQPASAGGQSVGIQAGLFIVRAELADADGSHVTRGVYVDNEAKHATHAFGAGSHSIDTGAYSGTWGYLLDGTDAIVTVAAIKMPVSDTGNVGTIIEYDANDFTFYDRAGNTYNWVVGGNAVAILSASGLVASVAGTAGRFVNTTDNATVQALRIEGDRATPAANDQVYASWYLSDSLGTQTEFARISGQATVVTDGAEASQFVFSNMVGGALTSLAVLNGISLRPATNDLISLGNATVGWSDLFLAAGGQVRVNNVQVLTTQQAAVANASDTGDVVARLNDLLLRLRTHGVIAT